MYKVLIVATSHKTRGGITAVINSYKKGKQWHDFNCEWIETHIDRSALEKIFYFLRSFIIYLFKIWSADIVHIHLPEVYRKYPYMLVAKLLRKKTIVHLHITLGENENLGFRYPLYKYCFENADVVVVLSKESKRIVEKHFHLDNIKVIYNCSPKHDCFLSKTKQNAVLYASTLIPAKGYIDLIKAFSIVLKKYPDWKLWLAGNGEVEKAKTLSKELGIIDNCCFPGWISAKEKEKMFSSASIFAHPSYNEGFPMAVLEAWSYSLPVVCTKVGGLKDVLENEKNALTFSPGNIQELSQSLERLINDKPLSNKISNNSLLLSENMFSEERMNKEIYSVYSSLKVK
ncbi:MAG: glycosyltransferase family 4 protein [Bacteroidales bacterium]|nr:glycosyltransferase family 4 protein [Bacteroidales bacterium]